MRAVSGYSRDGACLELGKQTWRRKSNGRRGFLKFYSLKICGIWQNFYFYRILKNEKFKMEVEKRNFVTFNYYSTIFLLFI